MCDFCEKGKHLEDEYGEYEGEIVKLTPLPAIDLTTGMTAEKADPPYYCLFIYYDPEDGETGSFPIEYCPKCGRKLAADG